ncbi:glycosyltransferase [Candidatus Kaiserbacteria bacterium]|nr:glycosyltransferase [Candidatus Kaiserbacteria bacterium]
MADPGDRKMKIAAIVPAYNEQERIGEVLRALIDCKDFDEVLVVDDGSKDGTKEEAERFGVRVIRHDKNRGKARAMESGVAATNASIIMFCDADLRGLTHEIVQEIVRPVIVGETDMMIGMHGRTIYERDFVVKMTPRLGGLRAVRRELWDAVPVKYKKGFQIEAALNFYARHWGRGYQYSIFGDLKQTIKEKKYGFWKGVTARTRMQVQVLASAIRLIILDSPRVLRRALLGLASLSGGIALSVLGLVGVVISYAGPVQFLREAYAEDLALNQAPVIYLLIQIAANAGANFIATTGFFLLATGSLIVLFNLKNISRLRTYRPAAAERV